MKRLWLIVPALLPVLIVVGVLAFSGGTASADGGIHVKGTWGATPADCASCHRAHRAQAAVLLAQEETALCESCHGNDAMMSDLNVVAGTNEADNGALRGGGFEMARIMTDDPSLGSYLTNTIQALAAPGEPTQSKHNVGSSATLWAYGDIGSGAGQANFELECGKCHDPHGNGNYRVLRTIPSGVWSSRSAAPVWATKMWVDTNGDGKITAGEDVLLDDENPKQYTTTDYWKIPYTDDWRDLVADPDHNVDTEMTGRQVGKWCTTCHTRYLAPSGAYDVDSGDAIFKYRHATDPSTRHGYPDRPAIPQSCLQCHVGHGSNATVSGGAADVEQPDNTNPPGSDTTDSRLLKMDNRGICQKCHNK